MEKEMEDEADVVDIKFIKDLKHRPSPEEG